MNYYEFGLVTLLLLLQTTTPSFQEHCTAWHGSSREDTAPAVDIASFLDRLVVGLLGFLALTTGIMLLSL